MNFKKIKPKEKKWILKNKSDAIVSTQVQKLAEGLGINKIIANLLYCRGYKDITSAKQFLYMESEVLTNPWCMADMKAAVARISDAIRRKEKITVYGDYDVDGVTSVCTLYLYLKSYGAAVDYYIPNRIGEGYGVSSSAISALSQNGTKLIITVDTGITADAEVAFAKELGVDFVITDHHECCQVLPDAVAVVNPHRPDCSSTFKELAGVGVVFKLLCACEQEFSGKNGAEAAFSIISKYADLVAIGTIADVMPIKEENRLIVSYGLNRIEKEPRLGLWALIDAASGKNEAQRAANRRKSTKISSSYIGYTLAPRINAAGRIKSASIAVELFLTEKKEEAIRIANELCDANKERQAEENRIISEAYRKIEEKGYDKMPVIVLDDDSWHHGVIGIVSSRITEKYGRPSILVSFEGNGACASASDVGKGSGRSIKGMNLVDALCHCSDELVKFGGHELAAGLSVTRDKLDAFREKINEYASGVLNEENMIPTVEADLEISLADANIDLADGLRILEPYGVGNPVPSFIIRGAVLSEIASVGGEGKHTKLAFSSGKNTVYGMFFSHSPQSLEVFVGDKVDILFNIDVNEWAGRRNVQLIVRDVKPSVSQISLIKLEHERFNEIWHGARFSNDEHVFPSRDDFAVIYRLIVASLRCGVDVLTVREIINKLPKDAQAYKIGYIKLCIIIKVMQELNVIGIEEIAEETYRFRMYSKSVKTELEKSNLLRRLRSQQNN